MPRGGPRGNKKIHKGQRRHFTDESEIKHAAEKEQRQKEWRRRQGIESDEEEEGGENGEKGEKGEKGAVAPGDLPPSASSSEEESDDDSDKHKGVEHLIEVENPNRAIGRSTKKVTELQDGKTELTRREREEIEKQQAKANYQKMHIAGKTDEARADLARLAIIRKQREEAAKKRDAEKAKEEAAKKKS